MKNHNAHWNFKDSVQTKPGNPNIWYMTLFPLLRFSFNYMIQGHHAQAFFHIPVNNI